MTTDTIPFVVGSETSESAAHAKRSTKQSDERLVLAYIATRGSTGVTDDELEVGLTMSHQNASARRNGLVKRGLVKSSGQTRQTRTGRAATVWVLGKGEPLVGARNDRVARPNDTTIMLAAGCLELGGGYTDVAKWLRSLVKTVAS